MPRPPTSAREPWLRASSVRVAQNPSTVVSAYATAASGWSPETAGESTAHSKRGGAARRDADGARDDRRPMDRIMTPSDATSSIMPRTPRDTRRAPTTSAGR